MRRFISYKTENRQFASNIRINPLEWGYETWMDNFDLPDGTY